MDAAAAESEQVFLGVVSLAYVVVFGILFVVGAVDTWSKGPGERTIRDVVFVVAVAIDLGFAVFFITMPTYFPELKPYGWWFVAAPWIVNAVFGILIEIGRGYRLLTTYLADRTQQKHAGMLRQPTDYPDDWDDLRRRVYQRDHYMCVNCGATDVELHAHHIVPLRSGGTNNLPNLTTVCHDCHQAIHPHMRD